MEWTGDGIKCILVGGEMPIHGHHGNGMENLGDDGSGGTPSVFALPL